MEFFLVVAFIVAMGWYLEQIHFSRFQIFLSGKVNSAPDLSYAIPGKVRGSCLQTHMWFLALTILYIPGHAVVHTSSLCNYLKRILYCLLIKGLWDTHHTLSLGVIRQIPYIKLFTFPTVYQFSHNWWWLLQMLSWLFSFGIHWLWVGYGSFCQAKHAAFDSQCEAAR